MLTCKTVIDCICNCIHAHMIVLIKTVIILFIKSANNYSVLLFIIPQASGGNSVWEVGGGGAKLREFPTNLFLIFHSFLGFLINMNKHKNG